ncbi:hypothetical protein [Streptomyces sp. EMB24]|uniref:hypothetical protein n=1 Tax=Streptomyces sp. EMB24 TaxID=2835531 RepID=UPI00227A077D|nr:hypothetical protein [Streptomyces sp. EMB24]
MIRPRPGHRPRLRTGAVTLNGSPISFDGPFGSHKVGGLGREYGKAGPTGCVSPAVAVRTGLPLHAL